MLSNVLLLALLTQTSGLTPAQAIDSIARGEDLEAAYARLLRARQSGLWLVHARAKTETGEARQRLFETVGRFATAESEWALLVELKSGTPEGQLGALRGLSLGKTSGARAALLRSAPLVQASLREAVAVSLFELGGMTEQQLASLLASDRDGSREVALRYLARSEPTPFALDAALTGLRDASPRVVLGALTLAGRLGDPALIHTIADIARFGTPELASQAVETMSRIDGYSTLSELGSVIAFEQTPATAWRRAAEILRDRDRVQLVRVLARASDARRDEVASIAALGADATDMERVIDMLDDPSIDIQAAAMKVLFASGAAGRSAGEARLRTLLLPELETAIRTFLATPAPRASGELTAR